MRKESYFSLLIICSVFLQGNAVISNEKIEKSLDTHIRNKRVISHSAGGAQPAHVTLSRHLVQILVADNFECAGSILQPNIILTVRLCLYGSNDQYTVLSGSLIKGSGTHHRVTDAAKHNRFNIALLKIHPPITLSPRGNQKIDLYTGPLPPNPSGLFSGWGCTNITPHGERTYPHHLMAALLPIIPFQECLNATEVHQRFHPLGINICTLDRSRERGTCHGDEGGSLVYGGRLVGILSDIRTVRVGVHPDIFINLSHEDIATWIVFNLGALRTRH